MAVRRGLPSVTTMSGDISEQQVEVTFVGKPPASRIERAAGVSHVEVAGATVRCLVSGSFQPFLEALQGHEVTSLASIPTALRRRQRWNETK